MFDLKITYFMRSGSIRRFRDLTTSALLPPPPCADLAPEEALI